VIKAYSYEDAVEILIDYGNAVKILEVGMNIG
jgi:hypothetical protein